MKPCGIQTAAPATQHKVCVRAAPRNEIAARAEAYLCCAMVAGSASICACARRHPRARARPRIRTHLALLVDSRHAVGVGQPPHAGIGDLRATDGERRGEKGGRRRSERQAGPGGWASGGRITCGSVPDGVQRVGPVEPRSETPPSPGLPATPRHATHLDAEAAVVLCVWHHQDVAGLRGTDRGGHAAAAAVGATQCGGGGAAPVQAGWGQGRR